MNTNLFCNSDFLDYSIANLYPHFFQNDERFNVKLCEMSQFDSAFLCGLIRKFRPKNIIEVGLSAGATTTLILETIRKYKLGSQLTSLDLNKQWYRNKAKQTCFLAKEYFTQCKYWKLFLGYYLPELLANMNTKYDLCIIDTVHSFPGEILDLIAVLPSINDGGIIVLHDINLHMRYPQWNTDVNDYNKSCYVTLCAFSSLVGEKIICFDSEEQLPPNIGAVIVDDNTRNQIRDLFLQLTMPWYYMINDKEYNIYADFFLKNYGKSYAEFFLKARMQNFLRKNWLQIHENNTVNYNLRNVPLTVLNYFILCMTGRVDIRIEGSAEHKISVINCDSQTRYHTPDWLAKNWERGGIVDGMGHCFQSKSGSIAFTVCCESDGMFKLWLKGSDYKNDKGERIQIWVNYMKLTINNEDLFRSNTLVSHDHPYLFEKRVKAGEIISVSTTWIPDAFKDLSP